jgi:hypothetical protein
MHETQLYLGLCCVAAKGHHGRSNTAVTTMAGHVRLLVDDLWVLSKVKASKQRWN